MEHRADRQGAAYARTTRRREHEGGRLPLLRLAIVVGVSILSLRLFTLQVLSASFYKALATGQHTLYEELVPRRGKILVRDFGDDEEFPVATVAPRGVVYADPRKVQNPVELSLQLAGILGMQGADEYDRLRSIEEMRAQGRFDDAAALAKLVLEGRGKGAVMKAIELANADGSTSSHEVLDAQATLSAFDAEMKAAPNPLGGLIARLSKKDDPYEPVARNVTEEQLALIDKLNAPGIAYMVENARTYPETDFGGQVTGFYGKDADGNARGMYGLEGYFDSFLNGKPGTLLANRDRTGSVIGIGQREFAPAIDGGDLLLTIDRTLQIVACGILKQGVQRYNADSGALVIMEPSTGRILAMCGVPDFDPAAYGDVKNAAAYNNPTIFTPYEPGSIFKPVTIAAALDSGAITPHTLFNDTGEVKIDDFTIRNASDHVFGTVDMVTALEESVNTAMVFAMRKTGRDVFADYIRKFGFGELSGIPLKTEVAGNIDSLDKKAEVYAATASFGQGITTTPLQIATAYSAIANDGQLMKPQIIEEQRYPDGTVEHMTPEPVRQVISPESAKTLSAMMVSVVEEGHGKRAGVPGYYIAGKTGTAQIAENGKYSATRFNGSFAGFGPVENPRFVMVVKIENPKSGVIFAESTAAPIFGEIAAFMMKYYGVPPTRTIGP